LAVGDAIGTALEFRAPGTFEPIGDMIGGGPFRLAPGQWTDDTSMALCLAESLIETREFDPRDQIERYVRWYRHGHLCSTGRCFDIGNTVRDALQRFERTGEPFSGPTDPRSAGNGSLMRLAPVAMRYANDLGTAVERAADSSRTTHGAPVAVDACRYFAVLLVRALSGAARTELLAPTGLPLVPEIQEIDGGSFLKKNQTQIRGAGYAAQSLEAALWAFASTRTFRDGCLAAANLGDDADTTAAIFGQLAGAFYGVDAIPRPWRARVALRLLIERFSDRLWALGRRAGRPD
jgi:ADP-ribosylglycohydrolase